MGHHLNVSIAKSTESYRLFKPSSHAGANKIYPDLPTKLIINFFNYLLRIATTASIFAALEAGKIPAKTPTTKQIITVLISNGMEI